MCHPPVSLSLIAFSLLAGARDDVGDSDKAMSDPKDLSRFNGFIDTFFRRLNAYSRSRFDPLGFAIAKKGGGDKGKKGDGEKK